MITFLTAKIAVYYTKVFNCTLHLCKQAAITSCIIATQSADYMTVSVKCTCIIQFQISAYRGPFINRDIRYASVLFEQIFICCYIRRKYSICTCIAGVYILLKPYKLAIVFQLICSVFQSRLLQAVTSQTDTIFIYMLCTSNICI